MAWKWTDHAVGVVTGWTWLDFSGGIPAESGRWFFTAWGAQRDWERTGPRRKLKDGTRIAGGFIIRRDKVQLFLTTWDRMHPDGQSEVSRGIVRLESA